MAQQTARRMSAPQTPDPALPLTEEEAALAQTAPPERTAATPFAPSPAAVIYTPPPAPTPAAQAPAVPQPSGARRPPSPIPTEHPSAQWGTGEKVLGTLFPGYTRGAEQRQQYDIDLQQKGQTYRRGEQAYRSGEETITGQQTANERNRLYQEQQERDADVAERLAMRQRMGDIAKAIQSGQLPLAAQMLNADEDLKEMFQVPREGQIAIELSNGVPQAYILGADGRPVPGSANPLSADQLQQTVDWADPAAAVNDLAIRKARAELGRQPTEEEIAHVVNQITLGQKRHEWAQQSAQQVATGLATAEEVRAAQSMAATGGYRTETEAATARTAAITARGAAGRAEAAQGMTDTQQRMAAIGQVNTANKLNPGGAEGAKAFNVAGLSEGLSGQAASLRPEIKDKQETGFLIAYGADNKPLTYLGADGKPTGKVAKYNTALLDAAANPSKWKSSAWGLYDESSGNYLVLDPDWKNILGGRGGKMNEFQFKNLKEANRLISGNYKGHYDPRFGTYTFGEGDRVPAMTALALAAELIMDEGWDSNRAQKVAIEYSNRFKGDHTKSLVALREFLGDSRGKTKPGTATRMAGTTGGYVDQYSEGEGATFSTQPGGPSLPTPTPTPEVAPAAPAQPADQVGVTEPTPEENAMGVWGWVSRTFGLPLRDIKAPSMLGEEGYRGSVTAEALRPAPAVANNQSRRQAPVQ